MELKDAMIIARGLMCEATMTNNTGLNSILPWIRDPPRSIQVIASRGILDAIIPHAKILSRDWSM